MHWVIDHLWLLIIATLAVAFYLSRRNASRRGARDDSPPGPIDRRLSDAAQAERTKRVREEIARKIAERRDAANQSPAEGTLATTSSQTGPKPKPTHIPPIDPFGGPLRRVVRRLVEWTQRRGKS